MYTLPVSIMYLPDWYVQSKGRVHIDSKGVSDLGDLNPSDMNHFINANETFFCYLYGYTGLVNTLTKESSINVIGPFAKFGPGAKTIFGDTGSNFFDLSVNLIESVYGVHSSENEVKDREERYKLLCKAFEDVRIIKDPASDTSLLVYHDRDSSRYHDRNSLMMAILTEVYERGGYQTMVSTELFRKFLENTFTIEDHRYAFLHKVG